MQTAGSGPDSPSTAIFATLPVTASGHPRNLGSYRIVRVYYHAVEWWRTGRVVARRILGECRSDAPRMIRRLRRFLAGEVRSC